MKPSRLLAFLLVFAAGHASANPVLDLIDRIAPGTSGSVMLEPLAAGPNGEDRYEIAAGPGGIVLRGNRPLSQACAFREAMERSGGYADWFRVRPPAALAPPAATIQRQSPYRHRNYLNICGTSYTQAYWDWARWEKELDLLAMRGFTQSFVVPGHHKVWRNTLRRLGYPEADIQAFLPAPSHTAWWLLGNLEGEGGPLPDDFIDAEAVLGRQIADRMRALGIEPVVFGFFGMVPSNFKTRFPAANVVPQGTWGSFQRPAVLDPSDPKFAEAAAIWYEELAAVYGPVRYHAGDLFHEGGTPGSLNVTTAASKVQQAMLTANPDAVWILESWQSNPSAALLAGTDPAHTLVQQLDLDQVTGNRSGSLRTFDGRPWMWCEVNNFGGNHGLYGGLPMLAKLPQTLLTQPSSGAFQGLGYWSEASETNPVYFDLFTDMFWRDTPVVLDDWIAGWVTRRYGASDPSAVAAWKKLAATIYNVPAAQEGVTDFVIGARPGPSVRRARTWCSNRLYWHPSEVLAAWENLLDAADTLGADASFRHDLVDVTRQVFNDHTFGVYKNLMAAYQANDSSAFEIHATRFLTDFDRLDGILATMPEWRLGRWTAAARGKTTNPALQNQLETTARQLITTWERGSAWGDINDYSSRSWAGLVKNYYKRRWEIYLGNLRAKLQGSGNGSYTGGSFEQAFRSDFALTFSPATAGDAVTVARSIRQELGADFHAQAAATPVSIRWALDSSGADHQFFAFDPGTLIDRPTGLKLVFQWDGGNNALEIHRVDLLRNGAVVSSDIHFGRTGVANTDNVYRVNAAETAPGDVWSLRAEVSGWGGRNSTGSVELSTVPYGSAAAFIGRWQYVTGGVTYLREWKPDGTCVLYANGSPTVFFNGYSWDVVDGVLRLKDASGAVTQTHAFLDSWNAIGTLYGPASRVTASAACKAALQSAGVANPEAAADADGDGYTNLLEWACGSSASLAGSVPRTGIAVQSSGVVSFTRRVDWQVEGLEYVLEASTDLKQWSAVPLTAAQKTPGAAGYESVSLEVPLGLKAFYRLRVRDPWK